MPGMDNTLESSKWEVMKDVYLVMATMLGIKQEPLTNTMLCPAEIGVLGVADGLRK